MGQCGCGDFCATHKLPGPDGTAYAFDVYPGCQSCGTGVSVVVSRFSAAEAKRWGVPDLPDLPFHTSRGEDYDGQHALIPIYHPENLVRDLWEAQADPSVAVMKKSKRLAEALPDGEDFAKMVKANFEATRDKAKKDGWA